MAEPRDDQLRDDQPCNAGRRLVLLRHGRTDWNRTLRIQGQADSRLDDVGHAQAEAVAPVIAKYEPRVLWSSDLSRARATAQYVAEATGLQPTTDPRLREFSLGEREGMTHDVYAALDADEYARFRAGDWDDIPGAETREQVARRFTEALGDVVAQLAPGETGVVVAHGAAIRTGTAHWLGWPTELAQDLRALGNCGRLELAERPSGRWALAAYNLTESTG